MRHPFTESVRKICFPSARFCDSVSSAFAPPPHADVHPTERQADTTVPVLLPKEGNMLRLPATLVIATLLMAATSAFVQEEKTRRYPGVIDINPPPITTDKTVKYDYDIVYVRAPRKDPSGKARWAEVGDPRTMEPGADLMLLHPDGKEEVLVAVQPKGVDRRSVCLLRWRLGVLRQDARRPRPQGFRYLQDPRADAKSRPADAASLHAQHRSGRLDEDAAAILGRLQPRPLSRAWRKARFRQRSQCLQGLQCWLCSQCPGLAAFHHGRRRQERRVHRPLESRHGGSIR